MKIVVYGNSIAAFMSALALNRHLGSKFELSLVMPPQQAFSDMLYGGATSPDAYNFHLWLGLSEPELLLQSNSGLSFGAHYKDWSERKLNWIQSFSLPFPIHFGVEFHQVLIKYKEDLAAYLLGTQAAFNDKFAHPPENQPNNPLSRAEYGYHFDYKSYANLLKNKIQKTGITIIDGSCTETEFDDERIKALFLDTGQRIEADLVIDCSGDQRELLKKVKTHKFVVDKALTCQITRSEHQPSSSSCSQIKGDSTEFRVTIPVQDQVLTLDINTSHSGSPNSHCVEAGCAQQGWEANCIGIGHAAAILSPHSTAPFRLLKKDIERLLELIPIDSNMTMERKEFNRRFKADTIHAKLFNDALFDTRANLEDEAPEETKNNSLLNRKIEQYLNRGLLVSYDYEPFNVEDWKILHFGMRRQPRRYDVLCDSLDNATTMKKLTAAKQTIAALVPKMPPSGVYIQKFKEYWQKRQ